MTQTSAKSDSIPVSTDSGGPSLYVNYFEVGHNPYEFLIELGQYHPGANEGEGRVAIYMRVALAPPYAKMLSELLARAVDEHQSQHGELPSIGACGNPFDIVLSSLGDFEERARALRARDGAGSAAPGAAPAPVADGIPKLPRSRRGR
jgi:hypothetical protein